MNWSDIAGVVGKAAPILGGLLGGPAGAAVGGLISSALGTDATPDAVSTALLQSPDAAVKLIELQTNAKVQLQQLAVTARQNELAHETAQYAAEAADRASARDLAAKQPNDWVRPTLTILLILGAIGIAAAIFSGRMDTQLRDATVSLTIGTVIGYWFQQLKESLSFWFGTTHEAQSSAKAIQQFATAPGSVTLGDSIATGEPPK